MEKKIKAGLIRFLHMPKEKRKRWRVQWRCRLSA